MFFVSPVEFSNLELRGFERQATIWGSRRGIVCWRLNLKKTQEMPFIPTKSRACTSLSRPLGNAKHVWAKKQVSDAMIGTCQLGEKTLTENIVPSGLLGGWACG